MFCPVDVPASTFFLSVHVYHVLYVQVLKLLQSVVKSNKNFMPLPVVLSASVPVYPSGSGRFCLFADTVSFCFSSSAGPCLYLSSEVAKILVVSGIQMVPAFLIPSVYMFQVHDKTIQTRCRWCIGYACRFVQVHADACLFCIGGVVVCFPEKIFFRVFPGGDIPVLWFRSYCPDNNFFRFRSSFASSMFLCSSS